MLTAGTSVARGAEEGLRDGTLQTGHHTRSTRPVTVFYAVMAFLLTCLFFVVPLQLSARTNQSIPRQLEEEPLREESHESGVKAAKLAPSHRKAPLYFLLTLSSAARRDALPAFAERHPDIAECWDAHSHRRRGPPSTLLS